MTTLPQSHLDYAPAPRAHRRATHARRIAIALALLLTALAVTKWYAPARDHLRLLHYQSRCLKGLPAAAPEAFHSGKADRLEAQHAPNDWDRFYALFSPPGGRSHPNVFTGELRHKDGRRRLVAVDVDYTPAALPEHIGAPPHFAFSVIDPAGLLKPAKLNGSGNWVSPFYTASDDAPAPKVLRLFTGQPDPNDPAHFTIPYIYDNKPGTIDVWLRPDDTILFELRDAPW